MDRYENANKLLTERFGKDNLIAIATNNGNQINNRMVDSYYEDGAFYVVTYTLSKKMKDIESNPNVAICGIDWFTAHGIGENLGWVRDDKNAAIMAKLREAFASWYTGGHVNEDDPNTCLLCIRLTDGILTDHEKKYGEWQFHIDFINKQA